MDITNSWLEEKRSAYLYEMMAENEKNILHKKLFLQLKDAAEKQAALWEKKMRIQNLPIEEYKPNFRTRLVVTLIKIFGTERLHTILSAMKIRGMSIFSMYHSEHKHTNLTASSNLRAAVFGINDGLVSNVSLILGIAGASSNHHLIILAGVAGLLAGACSMAAGEYVSVRSQREVFEHQIAIEKNELEEYPEEEKEELSLIYQARNISKNDADKLAQILITNSETGLNTLAREELGINPEDLVSPFGAMISSFISFAIGAFIPVFPFLVSHSVFNLQISIAVTAVTLFAIGAILSLYTNRNPFFSGFRMLLIGFIAGSTTFIVGKLLGTNLF